MPKRLSLLYATFGKNITKIYTISMSSVAKNLRKNQQGFSAWIIVLFLMLILVLLLVFWYVRQQDTKKGQNNSTPASSSPQNASSSATQPQPSSTNTQTSTKYLEIKEYGVKVPLSADISDAYYTSKDVGPNGIDLRVKALDSESDCKNGDASLASIVKVGKDETSEMLDGKKYSEKMPGVTVGNNFYYLGLAQYYCSETQQSKIDQVRSAFSQAAKKLEKL